MSSYNLVVIMGNLTRTPELRSTPGGTNLTDVTLAINDAWTDKAGNKNERVTFVDVTFWGKAAETLCRWKKQGDPLLVEGRLQQDKWVDKQTGQNRSKLKVQGVSFQFIARGGDGGAQSRPQSQSKAQDNEPSGYDDYATSLPNDGREEPPF